MRVELESAFWRSIRPARRAKPSDWCEENRIIPANGVNPEPGKWRNDRTPYLAEIMDTLVEPGVTEVVFLKPTQVGFSECVTNMVLYAVDCDPGACMILQPDEMLAKEFLAERIAPSMKASPSVSRHMSEAAWDNKTTSVKTDTMPIFIAWAGSPTRLASRAIRWLLPDEIDKYPAFSGREADPLSLAEKRVSNWGHRARILKGSTPTTRHGRIWMAWEACGDQRRFWVRCPHCGRYQVLVWSQVKWPKREGADRVEQANIVEQDDLAYYECEYCGRAIKDHHKPDMLRSGVWASQDQTVNDAGVAVGPRHRSARVGFHLTSLYSPWLRFSQLSAEWLLAQGDAAKLMDFRNSRLAEPFEEQASKTKRSTIEQKREAGHVARVVPDWAPLLLVTADKQKGHLYWVARAWGHGKRSRLIDYGMVANEQELIDTIGSRQWRNKSGQLVQVARVAIDAGYETDDVYSFCASNPAMLWPVMGDPKLKYPVAERKVNGYDGVIRRNLAVNYWKDVLHGLIHGEPEQWEVHKHADDVYASHLVNEHKVFDPKKNEWCWVPVSSGARVDYWDCEVYQCAMAQLHGVDTIPAPEVVKKVEKDRQREMAVRRSGPSESWANSHRGRYT